MRARGKERKGEGEGGWIRGEMEGTGRKEGGEGRRGEGRRGEGKRRGREQGKRTENDNLLCLHLGNKHTSSMDFG